MVYGNFNWFNAMAVFRFLLVIFASLFMLPVVAKAVVKEGMREALQSVLNSGEDLVLEPNVVYELDGALNFKKENQKLYTKGAKNPSEYAVLRLVSDVQSRLLNGLGVRGVVVKNVVFDGSKYSENRKVGIRDSLVQMGGRGGDNQVVQNCVFLNSRGWSMLHVFEPAKNIGIFDNFFFSSGADCRGSGAHAGESLPVWGDGISLASKNSKVAGNIIIDPTDVGIVVFCASGSLVERNAVAAVSREALGGINMVDAVKHYLISDKKYDYRGVCVRENFVEALGARVHIAYPIGKHIWGPGKNAGKSGIVLVGGELLENEMSGKCMGYGIAVSGAENFIVKGNVSTAKYSRIGDGLSYKLPDGPCAFIYDFETVKGCELQPEFKKSVSHIIHLLACNFGKKREDLGGFRMYGYGDFEAEGAIETAYLEMLCREPSLSEFEYWKAKINDERLSADAIRLELLKSGEFKKLFGDVKPCDLHCFRAAVWLNSFSELSAKKEWALADAKDRMNMLWRSVSGRADGAKKGAQKRAP